MGPVQPTRDRQSVEASVRLCTEIFRFPISHSPPAGLCRLTTGYPPDTPVAAPCCRPGSWQPEIRQRATRRQVQTRETYRKGDASKAWSGILAAKSTLVSLPVPERANCSELHGGHRFPSRTRMPGLPIGISRGSLMPGLMASCSLDAVIGGPRPTLFPGASGGVCKCSRCCLSSLVIGDLIASDR